MIERDEEALVKEDRYQRQFWQLFLLQFSVGGRLETLCFVVFHFRLHPS
jgi:hypothetical protein